MSVIQLRCVDKALLLVNSSKLTSNAVNADSVSIDFDDTWDDYTKTAVFYRTTDEVYYKLLDSENTCTIPKEVLTKKAKIYISVFGVNGDIIRTASVISYKVDQGAITENLSETEITEDLYQQILEAYNASAKLDENGKIYRSQIPEILDPVQSFSDASAFLEVAYPSFNSYVNWSTDLTEYEGTTIMGVTTLPAGYRRVQFALDGHTNPVSILTRAIDNEVDWHSEWEWLNPPMDQDVEYRTMERFNGKPVYRICKTLSWLSLDGGWYCEVGTEDENPVIIDVKGYSVANGASLHSDGLSFYTLNNVLSIDSEFNENTDFIVDIKYIKN